MTKLLNEKKILLTNIQRFSLHDGPGIRTTVFLKGCSLRCPWCTNPENIEMKQQEYHNGHEEGIYGKYMTCDEIYEIISRDKIFYKNNIVADECAINEELGGVTFSGGEALLQADKLTPLLKRIKKEKIHIALETSLFVSSKQLEIALQYVDLFYVDIKILNPNMCKKILQGNLDRYIYNVERLMSSGKKVIFRVPIIHGYTDTDENRNLVINFLKKYKSIKVELLKAHNLGETKYRTLGLVPPIFQDVSSREVETYWSMIHQLGIPCEILRI